MLKKIESLLRDWMGGEGLPIWYDPAYRLPISGLEGYVGIEPRRADFVAWFLLQTNVCRITQLKTPLAVPYELMAQVHSADYLESLVQPETLARIIGVDPSFVPVDEVLRSIRLACGATVQAARWVLENKGAALNLLGGFHHAGPDYGADLCPINDVACAVAAVRQDGFEGRVAIIDLDAHTPDGTADCLRADERVWIGSLTSAGSSHSPGVHHVTVPAGCPNAIYREAFERLLEAMPEADLAFVNAGGDVLAGDRFGNMGLNLEGARRRDLAMARALRGTPAVWLPGGGYHRDTWRLLAGTALVLSSGSLEPISEDYDPLGERYDRLAKQFKHEDLDPERWINADELAQILNMPGQRRELLLGFYTAEAIEYALFQFGILHHLGRLGYDRFRVDLENGEGGDRLRIFGWAQDEEHMLIESTLEKQHLGGVDMLYVNWLTLRNPIARFSKNKGRLPGQETPGLGMAQEAGEMLIRIAKRLKLQGLAYRPAWYHTAYAGRYYLRFIEADRQGRFEAMMRDFSQEPLLDATTALYQGRVTMNDQPYTWEADAMAYWLTGKPDDKEQIAAERERVSFKILAE